MLWKGNVDTSIFPIDGSGINETEPTEVASDCFNSQTSIRVNSSEVNDASVVNNFSG